MRPGLTYSWESCRLSRKIVVVRAHLKSASQGIRDWDTARVFIAKLHFSLLGMSSPMICPMIEVQAQLRSATQSRMMFWDFNVVNFGKLQLIVDVSFQARNA
jgi:hypothetical protein